MKPASREYADPILGYLGQVIGPGNIQRGSNDDSIQRLIYQQESPTIDLVASLQDGGDRLDL